MPILDLDGLRLNYLDHGLPEAPAVMLVHAFPLNAAMWEPQFTALTDRLRMVAPDLIGFGASDAPADPSAYSMDAYADQVVSLSHHLGLGPLVLVGLSMGGYVAFAVLRRHPSLVRALVLADTRAEADSPEAVERRSQQQQRVTAGERHQLAAEMAESLVGKATDRRPEVVQRVRTMMTGNPPEGWIGALEAMKHRADATPELEHIAVASLVVVGEHDAVTPPEVAEAMYRRIPGARMAVVPRAGHLSSLENPEAFNAALWGLVRDL